MLETVNHHAIVLGGGPAGISCALELHENKVDCVLIDRNPRLGGQIQDIKNTIRNFAARFWESGAAMREDMESLCERVGLPTVLKESISQVDLPRKRLIAGQRIYQAEVIFLATGTRLRDLPIERAQEFSGHITWWVEENEELLSAKPVAVVGGGDNALMNSLWLAKRCPKVILVHRSNRFKARTDVINDVLRNPAITILTSSEVAAVDGVEGKMTSIIVRNLQSQETSAYAVENLVISIGYAPNSELFHDQIKLDAQGFVIVDRTFSTGVDGVFAGGDIISPDCHGIAKGVGDGMLAARAMIKYLRN